jgi:hypothetical protein
MSSPAGWYPQPDGQQRYWDGELWTEQFAQAAPPVTPHRENIMEVKGHNGTVIWDGDFVTIRRTGFLARTTVGKGEKRIPISSMTAVQWKPAGVMVNGFIQFTVGGGNEKRSKFGSQTSSAVNDENSVVFIKKQMAAFDNLRSQIEHAMAERGRPSAPAAPAAPDHLAQLKQLGELREAGVLSVEEFSAKKTEILGRL